MENEDGVAAVVALMLLLAVIVTFLSLYATMYLPALKQQAEIQQITSVKEAFMRFDNDIGHIISDKIDASYGETIQLGGGDILLSPEKTSSSLAVEDTTALFNISWTRSGVSDRDSRSCNSSVVRFEPVISFWERQGYSWQYGFINVTQGRRQTPLSDRTVGDVNGHMPGYAGELLTMDSVPDGGSGGYLRNLTITVVTIVPGSVPGEDRRETSGSSACTLRINASVNTTTIKGLETLTVTIPDSPLRTALAEHTAAEMNGLTGMIVEPAPGANADVYTIRPLPASPPVTLTIRTVTIAVYVR